MGVDKMYEVGWTPPDEVGVAVGLLTLRPDAPPPDEEPGRAGVEVGGKLDMAPLLESTSLAAVKPVLDTSKTRSSSSFESCGADLDK